MVTTIFRRRRRRKIDRLVSVIGPAPSEQTFEDWLIRLGKERERVSKELSLFRAGLLVVKGKGKRKTPVVRKEKKESAERRAFLNQLSLIGMTEEEYIKRAKGKEE